MTPSFRAVMEGISLTFSHWEGSSEMSQSFPLGPFPKCLVWDENDLLCKGMKQGLRDLAMKL